MEIISKYRFAKSSDYKLRLILKLINNKKSIINIMNILKFTNKKSSFLIRKTIKSAVANAKNNFNINIDKLRIKNILINKGPSFKKIFPRAKGRINYIKRKTSHIVVKLEKI